MTPAAKGKGKSKVAAAAGPKKFVVTGDLTLHGVTKPVVLTGEYLGKMSMGVDMKKVAFTAHGSINRQDYGVKWNRMMEATHVVSDDVKGYKPARAVTTTPADLERYLRSLTPSQVVFET